MSSTFPQPKDWSMQAIPAAFLFGIVPHGYYVTRLMIATRGKMSNVMPRANLDVWKGKISNDLWNHLSRTRAAHLNSMEVFPLFAAAVLAGHMAKLPASDMNSMALSFFAARTVYMGIYMTVTNGILAHARSGVYAWSIAIPIMHLVRAASAMRED